MPLPLDFSCDRGSKVKELEGLEIGDWRKATRPETPLAKQNEELPKAGDGFRVMCVIYSAVGDPYIPVLDQTSSKTAPTFSTRP